jgi:hypothetical protein
MTTKVLEDFTFAELKEMYPSIAAKTKKALIEAIEVNVANIDSEIKESNSLLDKLESDEVIVNENLLTINEVKEYLLENATSNKKILIKCESTLDADDSFLVIQHELFPVFNEMGLSVMASNKRRDMHLNGSCYVRLVCSRNHDHLMRLMKYTDFKDLK